MRHDDLVAIRDAVDLLRGGNPEPERIDSEPEAIIAAIGKVPRRCQCHGLTLAEIAAQEQARLDAGKEVE